MRGKIAALVAAVAAAASAAGAATLVKRRKDGDENKPEAGVREAAQAPPEAPAPSEDRATEGFVGDVDDLTAIRGLGKVKAAKLIEAGITTYAQIAAWTDEDIAEFGLKANTSPGQIKREDWVGQAKALAEG